METATSNMGGWFGARPISTGSPSRISTCVLAASLLVGAWGTGAYADEFSLLQHERNNENTLSSPVRIHTVKTQPERTTAEDIAHIRRVLSPAVSDLAKSLNVSRQTIYNWLGGEQPTPEHTVKLKDLALAADMFVGARISVSGVILKRKIINGKNLFELVQDGDSAQNAAQLLLQIVRKEISQREQLAVRLAGRKAFQPSADSDIMAENDKV